MDPQKPTNIVLATTHHKELTGSNHNVSNVSVEEVQYVKEV
jgi:hypothetical protein